MSNKAPIKKESNALFGQLDTRKFLFNLACILFGLGVMATYFQPAFPDKVVLSQSDILQFKGMSEGIRDFRKVEKSEPLWTNRMFGGMPTYQISTKYPNNFLTHIDRGLKLGLPHPAGHMFLLFVGMFILLWALKLDPWVACIGAFAYAFSSYFFIAMEAGHNSKINALAYAPAVLAGLVLTYRGRIWLGSAIFALSLGLEMNANHYQITYYLVFIVLGLVVSELARSVKFQYRFVLLGLLLVPIIWAMDPCNKLGKLWMGVALLVLIAPLILEFVSSMKVGGWKATEFLKTRKFILGSAALLVAAILAVAPNLGRLYTTMEYKVDTMRGGLILESNTHCKDGQAAFNASSAIKDGKECISSGGLKKPYAYNWSYGIGETWTLLNPYYMGDASGSQLPEGSETYDILKTKFGKRGADQLTQSWPTYYGAQPFTSGPVYIGAVICFLFVLGLIVARNRYKWWLLGVTALGIMLSWGKNWQWFSDLFFDHFPMYNNFRAVSMTLIIAELAMPVLAALALSRVLKVKEKDGKQMEKLILIAGGAVVALILLLMVMTPGIDGFVSGRDPGSIASMLQRIGLGNDQLIHGQLVSALAEDRATMFNNGMWRSLGFVVATVGILIGYLRFIKPRYTGAKAWQGQVLIGIAILALTMFDLIPINKRYINEDSFVKKTEFMKTYNKTKVDNEILADREPGFRVLNLGRDPWNDAFTSYHHRSIGGYHAAKFRRYQDMIDCYLDAEKNSILKGLQTQKSDAAFAGAKAMNMLNLKWVMVPTNKGQIKFENPARYGPAWIVEDLVWKETNIDEIDGIREVNPAKTAVLRKEFETQMQGFKPNFDTLATIKATSYKDNHIVYDFKAPAGKEQLVVFSEIYYAKGWNAYIDGEVKPHVRANYLLRALRVPGGNHKIEFKFEPASYQTGEMIGLIGSLALLLSLVTVAVLIFRNKLEVEPDFDEAD